MEAMIRPARLEDAGALQHHCYPDHAIDEVRDYLAWCQRQAGKGRIVRLVAEVDGQAVANGQLTVWGREGEIGSLVVGQEYRRRGLAARLLSELMAEARRLNLVELEIGVCECQPAILTFYERLGFRRVEPAGDGDKKNGLSHPARPGSMVRLRMPLRDR